MLNKGEIVCTLAPSALPGQPVNPRNSEGAFIRTRDGRILFIYSRFEGETWYDDANCDIACVESADEGKTWSEPRMIFRAADLGLKNIMSVSLLRLKNGDIGLFFLYLYERHEAILVMYRSSDEGSTWSNPVNCIDIPGYYVVNNDRVIQLANGRLVVPAAFHPPMRTDENRQYVSMKAANRFFISDDDGITWSVTPSMIALNSDHSGTGLQEPGVVELSGGIIWAYARTDLGRQYEYFSIDGGSSWTQPQPSAFTSPDSPMLIKRNPYNNLLYSVWNPVPRYPGREIVSGMMGRTPLVIAVSADEGKTWSEPLVLEDAPDHGYCYPALHFEQDYALVAYCAGAPEDECCLNRLVIRRIEL